MFIPFQDDSTEAPSENDIDKEDSNDYGTGDETELPRSGRDEKYISNTFSGDGFES